jgi:hypothetical protein
MAELGEQLVAAIERTMEPAHTSLVLLPARVVPRDAWDVGSSNQPMPMAVPADRVARNDSRNALGTRCPYDDE